MNNEEPNKPTIDGKTDFTVPTDEIQAKLQGKEIVEEIPDSDSEENCDSNPVLLAEEISLERAKFVDNKPVSSKTSEKSS